MFTEDCDGQKECYFFNKEFHTLIGYGDNEMENDACKKGMHLDRERNMLEFSFV